MQFSYFSRNGDILPIDQAVVPIGNIEYAYGFGVYETIRVSKGIAYFADQHVERLLQSARIISLEHSFSASAITKYIDELIQKYTGGVYNLKILLIGSSSKDGATLYINFYNPIFPPKKLYRDGVRLITYKHERLFPRSKNLDMLNSYMAYRQAKSVAAYDALFTNHQGYITEGTRTNFFVMSGRTIISPIEVGILPGIMRSVVLMVAEANGYGIVQKDFSLDMLADYDTAFATSTSSKLLPVCVVDSHNFGPPNNELKKLMVYCNLFLDKCGGKL